MILITTSGRRSIRRSPSIIGHYLDVPVDVAKVKNQSRLAGTIAK
jgi:hypothetical protein